MANSGRLFCAVSLLSIIFMTLGCSDEKKEKSNSESPATEIKIIAHRGDSYAKPENTMAAFMSAWQKGADVVETDVYLTTDNKIVAIHDKNTQRTGDKDLPVMESSSQELRSVDVGSFKSKEFAGEKIPFLEDIIASVPDNKQLFIEVKDSDRIVPFVKDVIEQGSKKEQMVIISFSLDVVKASKKQMPDVPAYWLRSARRDSDSGKYEPVDVALLDTVKQYNLDGLNVNYKGISSELVKESHEAGYKIYVWTVNSKEDIKQMLKLGVDGVTTDRVNRAKEILR